MAERKKTMAVRVMTIEDYEGVYDLWMTIRGFAMRSILCGHDGRRGCLYHVCVHEDYRMRGIGKSMVVHCMKALEREHISKVSLIAFTKNDVGNAFWRRVGWTKREDLNYYDFVLNKENIVNYNK